MSSSALEWIAAAYTLAIAVGLMTGGRLGDMLGLKRMLMTGLTGFVLASTACALAWSPGSLTAARVLQGLSAAMLTPQAFGLIRDLFPPVQMNKAFAALGPVIGLSTVAGPIVAGLLLKANLPGTDWRALFLINLPVGVFALLVGARVLPARPAAHGKARLDGAGTVLLAAVSFLLVFPLVDGRTLGWPAWIFAAPAATVPMLAVFAAHQRHRLRSGRTPLVEFSVLRKRSYVSGIVFVLAFFASIVGFSLTMSLFRQIGLGFTPVHASLLLRSRRLGRDRRGPPDPAHRVDDHGDRDARALPLTACGPPDTRSAQPDPGPGHRRHRHGNDLRPAVQHHHGRDRRSRGRLGVRSARVVAAARRLAGSRRPGHAVLHHDLPREGRPAGSNGPRTGPAGR